jgi:two-component system sensor histidine kinase DesK
MSVEEAKRKIGPGWLPFAMLGYLAFFFVQPAIDGVDRLEWAATILAGAAFVVLYFAAYVVGGWRQMCIMGAMAGLGFGLVPTNTGALVFFIYVGLFIPFMCAPRRALAIITLLVAGILLQAWWLGYPVGYWLPATLCPFVAGVVNINVRQRHLAQERLRLAQNEVENLAKIAERERIARDLHDVLGHTMSVIVLKSELASKLVDRDPERASAEMRDVERISRDALAEIREAIRGYRSDGIAAELCRARKTLETAGVTFDCRFDAEGLRPAEENVLALVVREAVTNVVRHARASGCRLDLERDGGVYRLEIADDGIGAGDVEGNGIRGMRERVEALGGTLRCKSGTGTRLVVTLPAAPETQEVIA